MKRKVATLQQQKSRANRRNHELTRNIKKYLSPDQLQGMWTSSMRGKQWSTETIQKGLKLRLACGSRGYNAVRELAVPLPSERTLQRRVENYKFSPGILHEVLKSLALKVKGWCSWIYLLHLFSWASLSAVHLEQKVKPFPEPSTMACLMIVSWFSHVNPNIY